MPEEGASERPAYRGSITTRATFRRAGPDEDIDVWSYVSADVGDPDGGLALATRKERWSGRFAGRLRADVDGSKGDRFDGLDDANDGAIVGRVYDAWADWSPGEGSLQRVRLGRQSDPETPVFIVYDGVRVESTPIGEARVVVGAYGGASEHQYEASNDGDLLYGLWATGTPWEDGRVRVDWIHAEDERALGSFEDDLVGLSLRQRLSPEWRASAAWTSLGGDSRDLDLDATWTRLDGRQLVRATYYELYETQSANPLEFDSLTDALFDWFPFRRFGLLAWTQLGESWRLEGGYDLRDVADSDDEGRFNRDVQRAHVTVSWDGALGEGTSVSLTADDWQSDASDVTSLGASASKALDEETDVTVGTYYSAYDFDPLLLTEREDVRTYYASYEHDYSEAVSVDASYAFQDTDFEEFHTVKVSVRWQF